MLLQLFLSPADTRAKRMNLQNQQKGRIKTVLYVQTEVRTFTQRHGDDDDDDDMHDKSTGMRQDWFC
jgi:hypothetical protein